MHKHVKKGVLLLFLLLIPLAGAVEYYADITIKVDNSGYVTITGNTNHPDLLVKDSQLYTTKKQNYWTLQIAKNDDFSDFVYTIDLPADASINYIKSSGSFRIEEGAGNIVIKGYGQNKSLSLIVQYEMQKRNEFNMWIVIVPFMLFVFFILFFIIKHNYKRNKQPSKDTPKTDFKGLTLRQKQIAHLLLKEKKQLTQTQIQEMLKIPKASVSRNIRTLELKGIIEKEKTGMSNIIRLK